MPAVYILDVPEFRPVLDGFAGLSNARTTGPASGYWRVQADGELALHRKSTSIGVALWYSALMGGFVGEIAQYDRDDIRICDTL